MNSKALRAIKQEIDTSQQLYLKAAGFLNLRRMAELEAYMRGLEVAIALIKA